MTKYCQLKVKKTGFLIKSLCNQGFLQNRNLKKTLR